MVVDRYEIGDRQTSACGVPTSWLEALDLMGAHQQTFGELVIHSPHATARYRLPWTFSTFDYRELCARLAEQGGSFDFETAKVDDLVCFVEGFAHWLLDQNRCAIGYERQDLQ